MNKRDVKKLALLGIVSGLALSNQAPGSANDQLNVLASEGDELYQSLDKDGQAIADMLAVGPGCSKSNRRNANRYHHQWSSEYRNEQYSASVENDPPKGNEGRTEVNYSQGSPNRQQRETEQAARPTSRRGPTANRRQGASNQRRGRQVAELQPWEYASESSDSPMGESSPMGGSPPTHGKDRSSCGSGGCGSNKGGGNGKDKSSCGSGGCNGSGGCGHGTNMNQKKVNEDILFTLLNQQGKAVWYRLSPESKKLAVEIANKQPAGSDKNLAVYEASLQERRRNTVNR